MDAAVFAFREWLLAELEERILSRESLPTIRVDPSRIDSAGGVVIGGAGFWPVGNGRTVAIGAF